MNTPHVIVVVYDDLPPEVFGPFESRAEAVALIPRYTPPTAVPTYVLPLIK